MKSFARHAAEWLGAIAVGVVVMCGLIGGCIYFGMRGLDAMDVRVGAHLSKSDLAVIDRSNCKQLRRALPDYEMNSDRLISSAEGVEAIDRRAEQIHCDPPVYASVRTSD